MYRLIFIMLICFEAHATVFLKQTVQEQIKEADGIIIGYFLRKRGIELEDGSIATQMIFKIKKEYGLGSNTFGMDEVIIHYPGGKFEDKFVKVEGVPEFVSGETVALLIKSRSDRYWGLNLGFGSFKVVNYGKDTLIINTIFPDDTTVGQLKLSEFESHVKAIKGSNMVVVRGAEYPTEKNSEIRTPASVDEGKNRAIASKDEQEENINEQPNIGTFWLIVLLAFLGGVFRLTRQKHTH